jgi:hypothetical protein
MKRSTLKTVASFFGLLGIIFIPFPFNITKLQLSFTDLIFGRLIGFSSATFFSQPLNNTKVYSDTVSMYILLLLLFIIALIGSLLLAQIKKWELYREKIYRIIYQVFIYYLALQLLKYGADKIFKNQFYLPEPNTLFTPAGMLDKDILYWSAMGTSYSYNIFLGALEIFAAALILIKRTRLIGLLLSLGILINVVAVNFGFDISVKLFSLFLLFINVYLLLSFRRTLYQLLLLKNNTPIPVAPVNSINSRSFSASFLQWLAIGLIALEVFYPFIRSGNFNGDNAARPYLHGAYEVINIVNEKDTLPAAISPVKRFFIHRDSYIIFQDQQDAMKDYKLAYDKNNSQFVLTDYSMKQTMLLFTYRQTDSVLTLQYFDHGKEIMLIGKTINWRVLPALRKSFHWTIDGK